MIFLISFHDDLGLSQLLYVVVQECQHVAFLDRYIIEQNAYQALEILIFQINKVCPQLSFACS